MDEKPQADYPFMRSSALLALALLILLILIEPPVTLLAWLLMGLVLLLQLYLAIATNQLNKELKQKNKGTLRE